MPKIPEGAKKPSDRKAKDEAQGKPVRFEFEGHTYEIDPDVADDIELMELMADMEAGRPQLLPVVLRQLVGADQWAAFKDRSRGKSGRVRNKTAVDFFTAADDALGESAGSQ